jgi:thiosulfate/3-mercaptopyruvate sulfurtransferase
MRQNADLHRPGQIMHSTLVSAADLMRLLPQAVIVDCRFDLADTSAGERAYRTAHLPGAVYAHLDRDFSSPITSLTGRHPLPDPGRLAQIFGSWGINARRQVVAYDAHNGMFAARLWWLLRWLGHTSVAVLDGGFQNWVAAGFPTTAELPTPALASFRATRNDNLWVSAAQVQERVQSEDWRVLDARAPERFRGDVEPLDVVAGHVPGARNHPFALNLDAESRLLPATELAARYRESLGGVAADHTIAMCGSGVTACHTLLAMEVAGHTGAKLYAGSWSEWIRDPQRGVAKGSG